MTSTAPHHHVVGAYHNLDQTVQELAGKIIVKRRDNESARQVQLDAIEKNEGFFRFTALKQIKKPSFKKSSAGCADGSK